MPDRLTLTELQLMIRDSIYFSLPDFYWVIAEVSELKENNIGHCYLELIEKNRDEKNIKARVKAIIWNNRYRFLKAFFENSARESFRVGIKILIKVRVEYHELYGLSLVISDIDPVFTLGDMAMKRQLIINRLEQEGVFAMNKELPFPDFPQRIAVISSRNAAGFSDFTNHLKDNNYKYSFKITLFEAVLQGTETEQSVIRALDRIASCHQDFDVAVIIRGGGSQSDLSWFDNYSIAFHVTQFPLPLITGIGHEKDISVTDLVANTSLKTPTAVANFLIDSMASAEKHIIDLSSGIITASRMIIGENKNRLESSGIRLYPLVRLMMSHLRDKLSMEMIEIMNVGKGLIIRAGLIPANHISRLKSGSYSYSSLKTELIKRHVKDFQTIILNLVSTKKSDLVSLENTLELLSPDRILKRGYSITTVNGRIIKSSGEIANDEFIDTQLYDGTLRSKVVKEK